jgi:hypothetical protein
MLPLKFFKFLLVLALSLLMPSVLLMALKGSVAAFDFWSAFNYWWARFFVSPMFVSHSMSACLFEAFKGERMAISLTGFFFLTGIAAGLVTVSCLKGYLDPENAIAKRRLALSIVMSVALGTGTYVLNYFDFNHCSDGTAISIALNQTKLVLCLIWSFFSVQSLLIALWKSALSRN